MDPPKFHNFKRPCYTAPLYQIGVPRPNGVCARGHKAEKRDCALRHNFDPTGSSLTWHIRRTRVHLPCKFQVSATVPSKKVSSSCCFAKGSRGGTWHVPRGTWRHVTNAIVVRRFGASNGVCPVRIGFADPELLTKVLGHTDRQTNTHPTNVNFDPLRSKSSFLRMDFVYSSSLRFWTRGHMFRAISFEISFVSFSHVYRGPGTLHIAGGVKIVMKNLEIFLSFLH